MILKQKPLPRRTFLKGAGTLIALPALEAMMPALSRAGGVKPPVRLSFVYVPNGIVLEDFRPTKLGPDFELTRILKPLEKFRSDLMVIGGLDDHNGNALGDGPGDHARAGAAFPPRSKPCSTRARCSRR